MEIFRSPGIRHGMDNWLRSLEGMFAEAPVNPETKLQNYRQMKSWKGFVELQDQLRAAGKPEVAASVLKEMRSLACRQLRWLPYNDGKRAWLSKKDGDMIDAAVLIVLNPRYDQNKHSLARTTGGGPPQASCGDRHCACQNEVVVK